MPTTQKPAERLNYASAGATRKNKPARGTIDFQSELIDLARNVAGLDEYVLKTADAGLLRATLHEYREQARAILNTHCVAV